MSLGRHTLANLAGFAVPMAVALATVPPYLGLIGPERFGVLAVLWSLLSYFSFLDLGLGRAVTQRLARFSDAPPAERGGIVWIGFLCAVGMGVLGGAVIFLAADYALTSLVKMSPDSRAEATAAIGWLAAAFPLLLAGNVLAGALQARLQFVEVSIIQMIGNASGQALPLAVAAAGATELKYLVPTVLGCRVLTIVALYVRCVKHVPLRGNPLAGRAHFRPLLGYGGWMSVMAFLSPFLLAADRLVISALAGARAVTFYAVPYDLVSRAMVLSGSLSGALFPRLASLDEQQGRALAAQAARTLLAIMTPTIVTGMFIIHPFLRWWVGPDVAQASWGVAETILVGVWLNALVIPHHARYLATRSPRAVALVFALEIPLYVAALWIGVQHMGVLGAACAWSGRVLLDTLLLLRLNGVLADALKENASRMLAVAAAFCLALLPLAPPLHAAALFALLGWQLLQDRALLRAAWRSIRGSKLRA